MKNIRIFIIFSCAFIISTFSDIYSAPGHRRVAKKVNKTVDVNKANDNDNNDNKLPNNQNIINNEAIDDNNNNISIVISNNDQEEIGNDSKDVSYGDKTGKISDDNNINNINNFSIKKNSEDDLKSQKLPDDHKFNQHNQNIINNEAIDDNNNNISIVISNNDQEETGNDSKDFSYGDKTGKISDDNNINNINNFSIKKNSEDGPKSKKLPDDHKFNQLNLFKTSGNKRKNCDGDNEDFSKEKNRPVAYKLAEKYNFQSSKYTLLISTLQSKKENISLEEFTENINELIQRANELINLQKQIPNNVVITQINYLSEVANFNKIISFLNANKCHIRITSLQPMAFSNWWTNIYNLMQDEIETNKLKQQLSKERKTYFYSAIAAGSLVACTVLKSMIFG